MSTPREHELVVDGLRVSLYEWRPVGAPLAVVHISHGAGEHARRYDRLARDLAAAGFAVVAADHPGHGRTGAGHLGIGILGPGGMRTALREVRATVAWARAEYPLLRLVEFGHSWGSLLGQHVHSRNPLLFDAIVWSGSTLMLPGFGNPGNFNARWPEDGHGMSWLTRDETEIELLRNDGNSFDLTQTDMLDIRGILAGFSLPPVLLRRRAAGVPMYIVSGGQDPVSYRGRGARALAWWYRHVSRMRNVTLRIYPDDRHEVFNELNRAEATLDLIDWLKWHLAAPAQLGW